jgi:hypothetical protein
MAEFVVEGSKIDWRRWVEVSVVGRRRWMGGQSLVMLIVGHRGMQIRIVVNEQVCVVEAGAVHGQVYVVAAG